MQFAFRETRSLRIFKIYQLQYIEQSMSCICNDLKAADQRQLATNSGSWTENNMVGRNTVIFHSHNLQKPAHALFGPSSRAGQSSERHQIAFAVRRAQYGKWRSGRWLHPNDASSVEQEHPAAREQVPFPQARNTCRPVG